MSKESHPGKERWDLVIGSDSSFFSSQLALLWRYRDLILLLVKRDFTAQYKQSILGPLWHVLQPIVQTIIYATLFGFLLNVSTEGVPRGMFFLSGFVLWNFFAPSFTSISNTFVSNASIFGKVYFPRMTAPIAVLFSNLIKFCIHFAIFLVVMLIYMGTGKDVHPTWYALLTPVYLFILALMALGLGLIISSLTTKYRDVSHFLPYFVQMLMFFTPVLYPPAQWKQYEWILRLSPLTPVIEAFRYSWIGSGGQVSGEGLLYSTVFAIIVFFCGAWLFARMERSFMDTV